VGPVRVARLKDRQSLLAATYTGQPVLLQSLLGDIKVGLLVDPVGFRNLAMCAEQRGFG
jgi:hypothetical protein